MRSPRGHLLLLGGAAVVIAAVQGLTGLSDLAFYAGPSLIVLGLLLSGRFLGEDVILPRRRPPRERLRPPRARWSPVRERRPTPLLERSTRLLRSPPAPPCAA